MQRCRLRRPGEQGAELVVERAGALGERDELRDTGEVAVPLRIVEPPRELGRERADVRPEHRHELARQERP